ncbi:MAG: hypothetical protein ACRCR1_02540 [Aeromonas sp.]
MDLWRMGCCTLLWLGPCTCLPIVLCYTAYRILNPVLREQTSWLAGDGAS